MSYFDAYSAFHECWSFQLTQGTPDSNSSTLEDNIKDGCDKSSNLVFQHVSYFDAYSAFTSSVLKLSTQARYTWCKFLYWYLGRRHQGQLCREQQLGFSTCELFRCIFSFISSVLKLSTQARYTRCTFLLPLLLGKVEPWRLEQLGLHMFLNMYICIYIYINIMSFNIWAISMQIQLLFHQCWSFQRKQGTRDSHSYCWEGWNRGDWSNVYKYLRSFNMSYFNAFSAFTSSVLKLSKQSRYTWCTFLSHRGMEPWRLEQLGLHMFTEGLSTCELFDCIFSFYFFSAEAFKTIKVHLMHIPIARKNGTTTIAATRFAYVYRRSFNMWGIWIWLYFQILLLQCWSFQNNQGTPDAHSYRKKEWNDDDCRN